MSCEIQDSGNIAINKSLFSWLLALSSRQAINQHVRNDSQCNYHIIRIIPKSRVAERMGLTTELWRKTVSNKEMRENATCLLSTFSFFGFHFAIFYTSIFGTLSEELLERTDGNLVNYPPHCRGADVVQAEWETQAQKGHRAGWWHKQAS